MLAHFALRGALLGLVLVVVVPVSGGMADTLRQCPKSSAGAVTQLFDRWNAALATGNPDAVTGLYADDAVLYPALSDRWLVGQDEIRTHFAKFLELHPQASVTMRAISTNCTTAEDIGTYVYRVTGRRKGTRMLIRGHYAIRYEFRAGDWRIVSQRISGAYRPLSSVGDLITKGATPVTTGRLSPVSLPR